MTSPAFAGRGPWCTLCGEPAILRVTTLNPLYPVGICQRGAPNHQGCGRVVATLDPDEAAYIWTARHRRRVTQHHRLHVTAGKNNPDCDLCAEAVQAAMRSPTGTPTAGA